MMTKSMAEKATAKLRKKDKQQLLTLKFTAEKEGLLSFARTIPWLHRAARNMWFIGTDL